MSSRSQQARLFAKCAAAAVLFILPSCSGLSAPEEPLTRYTAAPLTVDIFSARGFLGGSEYERYYMKENLLWRECGDVSRAPAKSSRGKLEGDEVLAADPGLSLRQRRVETVGPKEQALLKQKAMELLSSIEGEAVQPPPPGSFFELSDPGLFELSIKLGAKKHRIITSVDAVADKTSLSMERTHELFSILRGIGPTICDSPTFFGIARKQL